MEKAASGQEGFVFARLQNCGIATQLFAHTGVAVAAVLGVGLFACRALLSAGLGGSASYAVLAAAAAAAVVVAVAGALIPRRIARQLQVLADESRLLTEAVVEGRVDVRCDSSAVGPELRPIVDAMNGALDAFIAPILVAAQCVERISRGDIPPAISESYRGEFEQLRENLNQCIGAVNALVADSDALASAAVAGELATRADPSRHQGDFRKIIEGVNRALDAVVAPIGEAATVLEKLAQRDLRARVTGSYSGDHAKVKDAVNETARALHASMAQVASTVEQVSSAAGEIASSSQAVASGASAQASALTETTSSLESMAAMTKQSADNAQQADALARSARTAATEGAAAIEQMTGAMAKIKTAAEGTSQIIKDINEIAFQTNLLALNAAVEAARAGEAGRGFAVVAEEVRSLALRSKEAAHKTEELIRRSVKEACEGELTAKQVDQKLAEISAGISKVTGIVAEIAATSKEQSAGIDAVSKAVGEMDRVTQQNAANSEQSSSVAAELAGQARGLAEMISAFRLEGDEPTAPAHARVRRGAPAGEARR
jgi:methyl-accepting chemotaxis protein